MENLIQTAVPILRDPGWTVVLVSSLEDLKNEIVSTGTEAKALELQNDIVFTTSADIITIPSGKTIMLTSSQGNKWKIDAGQRSGVIGVGGTLYLKDILITGSFGNSGITIGSTGALYLEDGGEIAGNYHNSNNSAWGGGVQVYGGTFTMDGGIISGNTLTYGAGGGGGVGVVSGSFIMNGGEISGNTSWGQGGGVYVIGIYMGPAHFTMNGGKIINNNGGTTGIGVCITSNHSTFVMNGGEISGNTGMAGGHAGAFGVSLSYTAAFTMESGTISDNLGGVFMNEASFIMNDGEISGNRAPNYGGGVLVANKSQFTMNGGTITRNQAQYSNSTPLGGGVRVADTSVFTMTGGIISENSATNGGGVFEDSSAVFTLEGGQIISNTASQNGGGIYDASSVPLDISGNSIISGNTATNGDGGGIWIPYENLANLTVGPSVVFQNNHAIRSGNLRSQDRPTYDSHIFTSNWTVPFTNGYNNYDISYPFEERLYTVQFDTDGGIPQPPPQTVPEGGLVQEPLTPTREGYVFVGWSTDSYGSSYYDFNTPVQSDLTLYAIWARRVYSVTYLPGDHGTFSPYTTTAEQGAYAPPYPGDPDTEHEAGWVFTGWLGSNGVFYPSGSPLPIVTEDLTFTAQWANAAPVTADIAAYKRENGWNGPEVPFLFQLTDEDTGTVIDTASNASGLITFARQYYTQPGVHHYSIREISPSGNGWTTDGSVYPVTVTVTMNSGRPSDVTVDYPGKTPFFTNTYQASEVSLALSAQKSAVGATLPEGQFQFGVFDQNGLLVATASNYGPGAITRNQKAIKKGGNPL